MFVLCFEYVQYGEFQFFHIHYYFRNTFNGDCEFSEVSSDEKKTMEYKRSMVCCVGVTFHARAP